MRTLFIVVFVPYVAVAFLGVVIGSAYGLGWYSFLQLATLVPAMFVLVIYSVVMWKTRKLQTRRARSKEQRYRDGLFGGGF